MRDQNPGALARARGGVADARTADTEEHSVEEAALATDDYATQGASLWERQGDLFAGQPTYPAQEQAIIRRALEILEGRLRRPERPFMESPEAVVDYFRLTMAERQTEAFVVMLLDSRHCVIEIRTLAIGTVDGATVHPREVVRAVMETNAVATVLVHNHPTHSKEASGPDRALTRKIVDALALIDVRVLDHLIIAGMEYTSMAEEGLI